MHSHFVDPRKFRLKTLTDSKGSQVKNSQYEVSQDKKSLLSHHLLLSSSHTIPVKLQMETAKDRVFLFTE